MPSGSSAGGEKWIRIERNAERLEKSGRSTVRSVASLAKIERSSEKSMP